MGLATTLLQVSKHQTSPKLQTLCGHGMTACGAKLVGPAPTHRTFPVLRRGTTKAHQVQRDWRVYLQPKGQSVSLDHTPFRPGTSAPQYPAMKKWYRFHRVHARMKMKSNTTGLPSPQMQRLSNNFNWATAVCFLSFLLNRTPTDACPHAQHMNWGNHSEFLFTPHGIFKNQRLHEPMQPFPPFMKSKPELRDIFSIWIKNNKIKYSWDILGVQLWCSSCITIIQQLKPDNPLKLLKNNNPF